MTSESQRELLSPSPRPQALGPPSAFRLSTFFLQPTAYSLKPGLSLVELLIAIGILGVTMTLIGAAFPAGVAMSIAVSDETTGQSVFQQAVSVIRDNYSVADAAAWKAAHSSDPDPPGSSEYGLVGDVYLGKDASDDYDPDEGEDNRIYEFEEDQESNFSWSVLMKRMADAGPMGNLCQVVVVVSRRPSGSPNFIDDGGGNSELPELRPVRCDDSEKTARTIKLDSTANFELVPSDGYIIDGVTGTAYIIISRNEGDPNDNDDNTVTVLSEPPDDVGTDNRDFWVVPGPESGGSYSPKSPAIRVFQAMLYLP